MKNQAAYWIKKLKLQPHPEGGFFSEVYRSNEKIAKAALPQTFSGDRCFATSIYFLLKGDQFSAFHKLKADEIWHFYAGCGLTLFIMEPEGALKELQLGPGPEKGQQFQLTVKANQWFAACPDEPNSFSLVGCTMAPGFEFDDFELSKKADLIKQYPNYKEIITRFTIS